MHAGSYTQPYVTIDISLSYERAGSYHIPGTRYLVMIMDE